MRVLHLSVRNYKSIKSVDFAPSDFSVLLGANAAGKSNFSDCFDFLAYVYRHGLEYAVAGKGGYENIAFRQQRRTKEAIRFSIKVRFSGREARVPLRELFEIRNPSEKDEILFSHSFSFRAHGESIKSDFSIVSEELTIEATNGAEDLFGSTERRLHLSRSQNNEIGLDAAAAELLSPGIRFDIEKTKEVLKEFPLSSQELITASPFIAARVARWMMAPLGLMSVFRFSPDATRESGVPTPNPNLTERGRNLPAVIDWLQRHRPDRWQRVIRSMRELLPGLEDITTQILYTKTLGLFFKEENVGRPWTVEDVSDGTIRVLAMLVAAEDPRSTLLVLEEPEVSVHPWIVRSLAKHLRSVSREKTVIITSHSPTLVDQLSPREIWVVYRHQGQTRVESLESIDPQVQQDWEAGKYRVTELIDSGAIAKLVPGGLI